MGNVALGLASWMVLRGRLLVDGIALALVAVNALLSVTDEVGLPNIASLIINGALFVLLIVKMRRGLSK